MRGAPCACLAAPVFWLVPLPRSLPVGKHATDTDTHFVARSPLACCCHTHVYTHTAAPPSSHDDVIEEPWPITAPPPPNRVRAALLPTSCSLALGRASPNHCAAAAGRAAPAGAPQQPTTHPLPHLDATRIALPSLSLSLSSFSHRKQTRCNTLSPPSLPYPNHQQQAGPPSLSRPRALSRRDVKTTPRPHPSPSAPFSPSPPSLRPAIAAAWRTPPCALLLGSPHPTLIASGSSLCFVGPRRRARARARCGGHRAPALSALAARSPPPSGIWLAVL